MKRRPSVAIDPSGNWLLTQWSETVRTLQERPDSRRGQMVISDEALEACLAIVSISDEQSVLEDRERSLPLLT